MCALFLSRCLLHQMHDLSIKWHWTNNRNREHIAELNNAAPRQPFFFLKPPSSILAPGAGPVLRPKGVSLHYEIELGLIMGREVKDLDPRDEKGALDAIECLCSILSFTLHSLFCSALLPSSWLSHSVSRDESYPESSHGSALRLSQTHICTPLEILEAELLYRESSLWKTPPNPFNNLHA